MIFVYRDLLFFHRLDIWFGYSHLNYLKTFDLLLWTFDLENLYNHHAELSNVWKGMLLFIYRLNFLLQHVLIIPGGPGVKLSILGLFHLGKIIMGKEHFITGQASYGTIYQMIYIIIINQWASILIKKFWLCYNEIYCIVYVYFIYINFIAFLKGFNCVDIVKGTVIVLIYSNFVQTDQTTIAVITHLDL